MLKPCINNSLWDNTVVKDKSTGKLNLQLGFRQIVQFSKKYSDIIVSRRKNKYTNIGEILELGSIPLGALNQLAKADCFKDLNLTRRESKWMLKVLETNNLPLFKNSMKENKNNCIKLPKMTLGEELIEDYKYLKLSLRAHPVSLIRHILTPTGSSQN